MHLLGSGCSLISVALTPHVLSRMREFSIGIDVGSGVYFSRDLRLDQADPGSPYRLDKFRPLKLINLEGYLDPVFLMFSSDW